ncbi:anthranilate synthase component II [Deinococcus misasensis]|uniref:anthranilate synthase component II n=1 Tax=Deinococcus misasensis TaxID=392413 RepID=UPI0005579187|nr:aminodeoxychorismate/anthranilate synthase component II [Deinococcus misasensis]
MEVLMVDNYDSFTFNLMRYFLELGVSVTVWRNDQFELADLHTLNPDAIVISPGPSHPRNAGKSLEVIQHFHKSIPILGVCLGHQCIAEVFGAEVRPSGAPVHGKTSRVTHDNTGLFENLPSPLRVTRYHSLIVQNLPEALVGNAWSEDGALMGLQHQQYPTYGVQFHPESAMTDRGHQLLDNFLKLARAFKGHN